MMPSSGVASAQASEARWRAVLAHECLSGDPFVYGVRTTRIYCRPTCPSRRPKREHVIFFSSPREAASTGFRPCRRCRPDTGNGPLSASERVKRVCALIAAAEERPTLAEMAAEANLSPSHFHRLFKRFVGVTPREYATADRFRRLKEHLHDGVTVTRAIFDAGFGSTSRVYEVADKVLGMTPGAYRAGAPGITIFYSVASCSLGEILVAATGRGICAIEFGDHREELCERLQRRFPKAEILSGARELKGWVSEVVAFVESPQTNLTLPLDMHGTTFQQRVWKVLRKLPTGSTITYADLARRVGRPRAVRAAARACASNQIALAIPCHRVVRGDGDISGYRWGVARKQALLDRERRPRGGAK